METSIGCTFVASVRNFHFQFTAVRFLRDGDLATVFAFLCPEAICSHIAKRSLYLHAVKSKWHNSLGGLSTR